MRIFKWLILLSSTFFIMTTFAQNNDSFLTLQDLIPGGKNYNKYQVKLPQNIHWWGDKMIYVLDDSLFTISIKQSKPKLLFTKKELNQQLKSKNTTEIKNLRSVKFISSDKPIIYIQNIKEHLLFNFKDKKVILSFPLPANTAHSDFSSEKKLLAYTKDNNLFIHNGTEEIAITNETNTDIIYGQAVHRNEFGIMKGTFWSPQGNYLAFYRMDESMVTDYPLVDIAARVAALKKTKYPMAGMKSHQVTIGIFNTETKQTVYLKTGAPKEKYLTNIAWSPDEKSIYVAELNRRQDTCKLNCYDVETGKLKLTLFEETHPKYVEPEHPMLFLKSDPTKFIWQSKRSGYNQLYLYDISGKLIKKLATGNNSDVISVLGFDEDGNNLIYSSTQPPIKIPRSHYHYVDNNKIRIDQYLKPERYIYVTDLNTDKTKSIFTGVSASILGKPLISGSHSDVPEGIHQGILSNNGRYVCDLFSSQYIPGNATLIDLKSARSNIFYFAKNPYVNVQLPEIKLGSLKSDDGTTDLCYRMVLPSGFNYQKKYPVIVYVYGGPHSQMVENSWMGAVRGWDIYMAQKGYIMFTLDNRGTSNRGFDFENITHRQLGVTETQDQMTGVNYLLSLPYVDRERIGVHGWSFGGFMTLNLMLRHPDIFKVGVAGGPVTDWKYYEIMYGERYMGSPKENPEGYAETSMIDKAGNLEGRLLLIHGDEDPTVVIQHSLQFLKASIKAGTHPDFFVYPGHGHNMTGTDRVHLHEHITRYFEDFLK